MKTKLLLFIAICISSISIAQTTYVPDNNFEQVLIDYGYDDVLDDYVLTANINTVTELSLFSLNISDLTGIEDFTALTSLNCSYNNLYTLDVSQNINLTDLFCNDNLINGVLDLSQNTSLISIFCNDNVIDQLIFPQTTSLIQALFYNNEITSLDFTQNPNLVQFDGGFNQINGIVDLSQNTSLYGARLLYNSIDQLILPQSDIFTELSCSNNELTALNVDYNPSLERLNCDGNQITSLNLALNTALEELSIRFNMLTALDLSANLLLTRLAAGFNMLTSLDMSANVVLRGVFVNSNDLNYLSVKNGNNANFTTEPYFINNPSLTCIEVDNATYSTNNWTTYTDPQSYFSDDCSNLSVDEFSLEAVSLYPNPAQDVIFLRFKTVENRSYQFINVNNQIALEGQLNQQNESINLSKIAPGVYFLKLQNANLLTFKKIIKQ